MRDPLPILALRLNRCLMRGAILCSLGFLFLTGAVAVAQPCPDFGTLTVFVDNPSGGSVDIFVEGELAGDALTCAGKEGDLTNYPKTQLTCVGQGIVRCGQIGNLRPGAWIHRLEVTVPGSATQRQAQRQVLIGGSPLDVSNALLWTIYPRTFVIEQKTPEDLPPADELQLRLDQATGYTACNTESRALVTFSWDAFPGLSDPKRMDLLTAGSCSGADRNHCRPVVTPDHCPCDPASTADPCTLTGDFDGTQRAGLCFPGNRITIDALGPDARPGGVILSVAACEQRAFRVYGSDNLLRGLVFEGSQVDIGDPTTCGDQGGPPQVDTIAMTGANAQGNTVEQSIILGPTCGDAVSVDNGATDNTIAASRVTGAADRGVKVDFGGSATIERSCVHDNNKGGIQSTLGGHVEAKENVVQRNLGGEGQNGLTVIDSCSTPGCAICAQQDPGCISHRRSTLTTQGNLVRFSGGRGLSVRDNADATFESDYVANNNVKGSEVETTSKVPLDAQQIEQIPSARFHGVGLVCNYSEGYPGVGAETRLEIGNDSPDVSYGDAQHPGRNAFTSNRGNILGAGANFLLTNVTMPIAAEGNQWGSCSGTGCDEDAVRTHDIQPPQPSNSNVALVEPGETFDGSRAGAPVIYRIAPPRPQAGDVVRIYGDNFDAVNGNPTRGASCDSVVLPDCSQDGMCSTGPCVGGKCPCSIDNPAVHERNKATPQAPNPPNRILIRSVSDGSILADIAPDAVTPTMLAFRMPFDCYATLSLEVAKYGILEKTWLCDPKGCREHQGSPCDDGNPSTLGDRCDGEGECVGDPMPTTSTTVMASTTTSTSTSLTPVTSTTMLVSTTTPSTSPTTSSTSTSLTPTTSIATLASTTTAPSTSTTTTSTLPRVCNTCVPSSCAIDQCENGKLRHKAEKLARLICRATNAGRQPKTRWVRRLTTVLVRCRVTMPPLP